MSNETGERRLLLAVLLQASRDALAVRTRSEILGNRVAGRITHRDLAEDLRRFSSRDGEFSLRWICDALEIPVAAAAIEVTP